MVEASPATHKPNPNGGTICGLRVVPTDARQYDDADPTCPTCAQWNNAVKKHSADKAAQQEADAKTE
jgi:hypothetical protein